MCKEDYVSFETAKLLKEKGFPQVLGENGCVNTIPYYIQNGHLITCDLNTIRQRYYPEAVAPTLQMAMKWLREVHNIHIEVGLQANINEDRFQYRVKLFNPETSTWVLNAIVHNWDTYEAACDAALKYVLENLI